MDQNREVSRQLMAEQLASFAGVDCVFFDENTEESMESSDGSSSANSVCADSSFRRKLLGHSRAQEEPLICADRHDVVYLCLNGSAGFLFFGPIALRAMNRVELHRFYRDHEVRGTEDPPIPIMSISKILLLAQMAAMAVLNHSYTEEELLRANTEGIAVFDSSVRSKFRLSMQKEDEVLYHHTYQEERRITDAVAEGRPEDAVKFSIALDDQIGEVGSTYLEQRQRIVIIAVTVCTRAAIRGGVSPSEAYQISDFYIQKLNECPDAASMTACRNEAVRFLAERVRTNRDQRKVSTYVEAACDYIGKHYREKIRLEDISAEMGISSTYLSRLFSKEKGMAIQEYVLKIRIERAANLLAYSNRSIAEIGDYVNFPSQSYFGRVFKKYTGQTPKQYRDTHKPKEFTT